MKNLTWQATVLIGIGIMCLSGIAIAFISHDDVSAMRGPHYGAFGHMPPPPEMREGFQRGQGRGDGAFSPRHRQKGRGGMNGMRGERRGRKKLSSRAYARPQQQTTSEVSVAPPPESADVSSAPQEQ